MKFIDLFAGLGGFHIALSKLGAKCVFASEIDSDLRNLYQNNFAIDCASDIYSVDVCDVPAHDILCAGFPCQPFSKAGYQKGLQDEGRGDAIHIIANILRTHQPRYFILENVPNLKTHGDGTTWSYITKLLIDCGYQVQDLTLSPHDFGIPHKRERIFIIGNRLDTPKPSLILDKVKVQSMSNFLTAHDEEIVRLQETQLACLETWQAFVACLPTDKPLPKFPIWAMEFGATYPLESLCPVHLSQQELEKYKGAFGVNLHNLTKAEQLHKLPKYATCQQRSFPKWKINYIKKNRTFWNTHGHRFQHLMPTIQKYISSWQKLEWNAGDKDRNIYNHLLQFRSSGVRVKSNCSIPSLVLTGTQTPIVAWEKRYLTVGEAQRLQGFESIKITLPRSKALSALGNAVNTTVVQTIFKAIVMHNQRMNFANTEHAITDVPYVHHAHV